MKLNLILLYSIILSSCFSQNNKHSDSKSYTKELLSVRNAHAMAYNTKNCKVYLFGGADEKQVLADLWVLEKKNWNKIILKNTPGQRTFAAFTYDEKNDRLILFGGNKVLFGNGNNKENLLNDTWEFVNENWRLIKTKNTPSPRAEAVMVYDKKRERIVLFGGYTIKDEKYIKLNDTWEFYENDWHLKANTGPTERSGVAMTYDIENKNVLLFGGSTVDKQYGTAKGETWYWNGENWIKIALTQPNGVYNAAMTYDNKNKEIVRFGGWNGTTRINETWILKDKNWKQLEANEKPSARNHSFMVFNEKTKKIILFGGHDGENVFGDTWQYADHKWVKIAETNSKKRIQNEH